MFLHVHLGAWIQELVLLFQVTIIYKTNVILLFCIWLSCFLYILTFAAILWYTEKGTHKQMIVPINGECLNIQNEGTCRGLERTLMFFICG